MISNSSTDSEFSAVGTGGYSHPYNTRLSVSKSMIPLRNQPQKEEEDNIREKSATKTDTRQRRSPSIQSLFRRDSSEGQGEANQKSRKTSRTKFSVFHERSVSSFVEEGENLNSGDSSTPKSCSSRFLLSGKRRTSFLLEAEDCYERRTNYQVVRCENYVRMDPSSCIATSSRSSKCSTMVPCLIALGALIIIAIPVAKILGCMKRDITDIHHEMTGLKKQVGYVESEDADSPVAKLSRECSAAIKYLVKEELGNFDSDKTGKTDFALESAGGRVVKTINTENYGSSVGFLGLTLCEGTNGPRAMIQANTAPGECWAFKGSRGAALIRLLGKVRINAVSLEHISSKISPTGRLDTAPRDFSVYGLKDHKQSKVLLGRFEYKINSDPIQIFPVKLTCKEPFELVEFHVESNHGNPEYTCVYRFRVHGALESL